MREDRGKEGQETKTRATAVCSNGVRGQEKWILKRKSGKIDLSEFGTGCGFFIFSGGSV